MEGWNPSIGCTTNCKSCYRGWVPNPLNHFPRRDALIDAIGRTDNPCDRPARCPPLCEPVPKYKLPKEFPVCNLKDFQQEKMEAKQREAAECCEKYNTWRNSLTPFVKITNNCDRPICLVDENRNEEGRYILVDIPVRTNFLTGIFNPDDNKPNEQYLREKCDRFWMPCGGTGLRPYPCRGVIDFPRQQLIDTTQPNYELNNSICEGTKYVDPEFIQKQYEDCRNFEEQKRIEKIAKCQEIQYNWEQQHGACYPPGCPRRRCCD